MINNDLQCHDVTGILYFSLKFLTKRQSLPSCTPPVPRCPSSGSRCRVPLVAASDLLGSLKSRLGKPSILKKKRFFVKSLHKMVTPPPVPFYEVPIYFFSDHFLIEKKDDFEGCLKGVDGCFKGV